MSSIATIPISTTENFSLPIWLRNITMKRRKIELPPDDLPTKRNKSKLLVQKEIFFSRIHVDFEKTKYNVIGGASYEQAS